MLGKSLGLDIGSHAVKVVELRQTLRGVEVARLHSVRVVAGEQPSELLADLFDVQKLPSDRVVCAIPGDRVTRRRIHLPFRDRRRINQALPFEIESEMPFELEDVFLDWERVGGEGSGSEIAATVVPRAEVARQVEQLRAAGIDPRVLEAEGLVLSNLAEFLELPGSRLLVDLGHSKTTVCLMLDGNPRAARTFPVGAGLITEAIARERGIGLEEAERLKCERGLFTQGFESDLPAAVKALETLVQELTRTLGGFGPVLEGPPDQQIDELTLLGGGARLHRIDEFLAARTGIAAARLQVPPSNAAGAFLAAGDPLRFGPALALALRGSLKARTSMNFLRDEFKPRIDLSGAARQLRPSAVLAGIALLLGIVAAGTGVFLEGRRADRLEGQLAELWSQAVPGKPVPDSVPRALQGELRQAQQRADFLGIYGGNLSALDLLTEISRLVPAGSEIIFEELSIDGQVVRIRGHTPSFAAVDALKTALSGFPQFGDIRVSEIQSDSTRGGNNFSVTISLNNGTSTS